MSEQQFAGTAYSYIRFSSAEQERGDSLRRQLKLRDDWLGRHPAVTLDTKLNLQELGTSAFRGRHRGDGHALGRFLDAVRRGRVERGSLLLLENLDRLSREEEEEALEVLLGLLRAGVVVVQLEPETVFRKGHGMIGLFRAILELSRGHQESKRKSFRVSEAWRERQASAAKGKGIVTARCPAWLKVVGGKFRFKAGARNVIKRIFSDCIGGRGARMIAHDLAQEKVPHFGGGVWQNTYITAILGNRAVLGECQPMRRDGESRKRVKNGPPIKRYFPAAITLPEWHAAQKALRSRKRSGGRRGVDGWVALFGNVFDVTTGERLQAILRVQDGKRYRVLQPSGVLRWGTKCTSFPVATFEAAVLSNLLELDPAEVLPRADDGGRVRDLSGEVAKLEGTIAAIQRELESGTSEVKAVVASLRKLEESLGAKAAELARARQDVASPLHEQWGTLKGLAAVVEKDPDARLRVRAAAGRLIERIDCLIIPRSGDRLMAAQVLFRETGARRNYIISHWTARRAESGRIKPARWEAMSFAAAGLDCDVIDLRKRSDVADLERVLKAATPA